MLVLRVIGSPGSGKSYFVVEHVLKQHIEKGFSMFIYDYKYDDLTKLADNHYLQHRNKYAIPPFFMSSILTTWHIATDATHLTRQICTTSPMQSKPQG